jgi:hypothetical protein
MLQAFQGTDADLGLSQGVIMVEQQNRKLLEEWAPVLSQDDCEGVTKIRHRITSHRWCQALPSPVNQRPCYERLGSSLALQLRTPWVHGARPNGICHPHTEDVVVESPVPGVVLGYHRTFPEVLAVLLGFKRKNPG